MSVLIKMIHPTCGRTVMSHQGQVYDPVEGTFLTRSVDEAQAEERFVYLRHECLSGDIESRSALALEVTQKLRVLSGTVNQGWGQADYVDAINAKRRTIDGLKHLVARLALDRECPKCGVAVGSQCENLTLRRRGEHAVTKSPHNERIPAADTVAGHRLDQLRERLEQGVDLVDQIHTALAGEEAIEKLIEIAQQHR